MVYRAIFLGMTIGFVFGLFINAHKALGEEHDRVYVGEAAKRLIETAPGEGIPSWQWWMDGPEREPKAEAARRRNAFLNEEDPPQ